MTDASSNVERETDRYVVRGYEPGDRERFLSLYETVWGREKSTEWFDWRFGQNPYGEGVEMVVAERDGQLVGVEPLLPFRLRADGEETLACQPVDWIVHPDHRRRGLFTRMTERLLESHVSAATVLFNFPTDALLPGLRKFDWTVVGTIPTYFRVQRPSSLLGAASKAGKVHPVTAATGKTADPLLKRYLDVRDRIEGEPHDVTVERHRGVPVDELVGIYESSRPEKVHVAREEAFYEWRFANPYWVTTTYLARDEGTPVAGVVVASEELVDVHRTSILDVQPMAPEEDVSDAICALVGAVVSDHRDVDVLKTTGEGLPESALTQWGFRSGDSFPLSRLSVPTTLVVRPVDAEGVTTPRLGGHDLTDPEEWLLALGDQDVE